MKITTVMEKEDGKYEFTAVLTNKQHEFLLEYAIRDLLAKGLLPFQSEHTEDVDVLVQPDEITEIKQ